MTHDTPKGGPGEAPDHTCQVCGGSGFSKPGTGYDDVCDNCGGRGEDPPWEPSFFPEEDTERDPRRASYYDEEAE